MTTPDNISIGRLRNAGRTSILINFSIGTEDKITVSLPGGSSTDAYSIVVGAPGNTLSFNVQAENGTVYDIQLFYQPERAGNQFYYTRLTPGGSATPQEARNATTPGKNIALDLACDGVVVVGTGDL